MDTTAPLILICNDDGVHAAGLQALAESLAALGTVVVVAPDRERSAAGHSLTLGRPLRLHCVRDGWYSVDGTPTDCITLGIMQLLPRRPDLVAAGINHGGNLGDDVTYSGTVSCAVEATLQGLPAFAISLVTGEGSPDFRAAGCFAPRIAAEILRRGLPPDTLLNVNVPDLPPEDVRGHRITRQGRRVYAETVIRKEDPRGKPYYWIGGAPPTWVLAGGTDHEAVTAGWISVTPLHLDLTNHAAMNELRGWTFAGNGDGPH
jgi:5'-nucleotidase